MMLGRLLLALLEGYFSVKLQGGGFLSNSDHQDYVFRPTGDLGVESQLTLELWQGEIRIKM